MSGITTGMVAVMAIVAGYHVARDHPTKQHTLILGLLILATCVLGLADILS